MAGFLLLIQQQQSSTDDVTRGEITEISAKLPSRLHRRRFRAMR
jgi:hypothetical protein